MNTIVQDEKEKVQKAHEECLSAWNKLQDALLYIERVEI